MKKSFYLIVMSAVLALFCVHATDTPPAPRAAIKLVAAGSLTGAMTAAIQQYSQTTGQTIEARFGPSGLLREAIEGGEQVDIFASANMQHPQTLALRGLATPPVIMLRNRLCARALPEFGLTRENLLERMLDPDVGIGTSTPIADPGGDYAWMMFARAEDVRPGAQAILQHKAQQYVGGKHQVEIPAGKTAMQYFFEQQRIHISIGYCSGRTVIPDPTFVSVVLPPELEIHANYGLSVITTDAAAQQAAYQFALYLMSPEAQQIMAEYGFIPVAVP